MHIVVAGASGFLGSALVEELRTRGHEVTRLVRGAAQLSDESSWDPASGRIDQVTIDRSDAVVNLSGSPISQWPRTRSRRHEILDSRLGATTTIATALQQSAENRDDGPPSFISASGMSWYGTDRGDEPLTEGAAAGEGFLADVSQAWERATAPATRAGARTALLRTTLVLDAEGGVLKLMLPAFKLGGGAELGAGTQYMALISRRDWVRAVTHVIEHPLLAGPFNLGIPSPGTNADFTRELAGALGRPAFLRAPSLVLKAALGGMADDLLGSLRVEPSALLASGFEFEAPDVRSTIEAALR